MQAVFSLTIIAAMSYLIYFIGGFFSKASSNIGDYFNLSKSVKGATFDAISSSMPELMVALFAVISFKKFEVGIGTIVGSAFFNILIIPAICVLISPVIFKVNKEVINRDAKFYVISVLVLALAVFLTKEWGFIIATIFILGYVTYLFFIIKDTQKHRKVNKKKKINSNIKKDVLIFLVSMFVMSGAAYLLTEQAIIFSKIMMIPPVIVAFTIIAAATSVPDAVISFTNARRGDIHDATANAFGSNIFDIFIGLGVPLFLANIFTGTTKIVFENNEMIIGLLIASIGIYFMFHIQKTLTKKEAIIMLTAYALFFAYTIFLSLV